MQRISKQSHCVKCPVLQPLWNSLCGPLTKTFGDPLPKARVVKDFKHFQGRIVSQSFVSDC